MLGRTLGYDCSLSWIDPKVTHIMGVKLKSEPKRSYVVQVRTRGRAHLDERGHRWSVIRKIQPAGVQMVYDFNITNDQSYVSDGLFSLATAADPWEI